MITTDITAERAIIMVNGDPAEWLTKDYDMVSLAQRALSGVLVVQDPMGGDPIQIVDHPWLLQLAANLCQAAGDRMEAIQTARRIA